MGAEKVIARDKPFIIFEDSDETVSKYSRDEVNAMLRKYGYKQKKIDQLNTFCIPQ